MIFSYVNKRFVSAVILSLTLLGTFPLYAKSKIVVIGDSLSAGYKMDIKLGWVDLIRQKLDACSGDFEVINLSNSGDTTRNGLSKMKLALEQVPEIIIIELGGNDGLRGYPLLSIKQNLKKMIELSLKADSKVILTGIRIPPNYGSAYAEQFYAIYQDLSAEYSLPFVSFLLEGVALNSDYMLSDGIHPNAKGQPIIAQTVWAVLKEQLDKIQTSNCNF